MILRRGFPRQRGDDEALLRPFPFAELHEAHDLICANCGDRVDSFTAMGESL